MSSLISDGSRPPCDNRIDSVDSWPLQFGRFELDRDFELGARAQPEILVVESGTALHECGRSSQPLREGSVIVSPAGRTRVLRHPAALRLVRLRYLSEWMVHDIHMILDSPDLLSLCFARVLFDRADDQAPGAVTLRRESRQSVRSDLEVLEGQLRRPRIDETLTRVTLLKILLHVSEEYGTLRQHRNRLSLRPEILDAMRAIEGGIHFSGAIRLSTLEPTLGMSLDHLGRLFKKATGTTLVDYTQRRRVQHAARQLLFTDKTAKAIARELHFTDSAHFSKSFQRYFGRSPNGYRSHFAFNPAWLRD